VQGLTATVAKQEATIAQQQKDFQSALAQQRKDFESTISQQQKETKALAASLKEQASQIQKVSDHLELRKRSLQLAAINE